MANKPGTLMTDQALPLRSPNNISHLRVFLFRLVFAMGA